MSTLGRTRIGFVGGGRMAEAIIRGLSDGGVRNIVVHDRSRERQKVLKGEYSVRLARSNRGVAEDSDVILIAVKPGDVEDVCRELVDSITGDKLVISIAAGISLAFLRHHLGTDRVVRVMPNTPAFAGRGMTVIASSPATRKKDIAVAEKIFSRVGHVMVLDEKQMDAVTALSGSGPAFVSLFVEALVDGAVRMGIQRDSALELALSTIEGTVAMLRGGTGSCLMREMVTSPGGTTAEGLFVMERNGLRGIIMEAIESASERAAEIGERISEVDS